MKMNDNKPMEEIKTRNSTPGSRSSFLHCSKCPVEDYCYNQTSATCPLIKLVDGTLGKEK